MMSTPAPLIGSDVDLRDFPYMPLDVVRLRDSETAILVSGDGFRAAVLLWCAAWHQIPAASLPDEDRTLAHLSGFGRDLQAWAQVKSEALRGFVKCSDGRLYHPTIAKNAARVWDKKLKRMAKIDRRLEMESGKWDEFRLATFKRDNFTCQYCGASRVRLECDHVVPRAKGGKTELGNLKTACKPCNRSKGAKLLQEWRRA
jgi:hypothetical protein